MLLHNKSFRQTCVCHWKWVIYLLYEYFNKLCQGVQQ